MTQHYIGTKIILAWEQDKDGEPGYGVRYADGYQSWSPKDTFEEAYLALGHLDNLEPHVQRMAGELTQLRDKISKLESFVSTPVFEGLDPTDQILLKDQLDTMADYERILDARVQRSTAQ